MGKWAFFAVKVLTKLISRAWQIREIGADRLSPPAHLGNELFHPERVA